jgi:hypothetical protein
MLFPLYSLVNSEQWSVDSGQKICFCQWPSTNCHLLVKPRQARQLLSRRKPVPLLQQAQRLEQGLPG